MKKILTALGNATLNNELKKYSKYDVMNDDFFYQEAVLDYLEKEEVDVVIISSLLQGQYDMIEFLKEVKKKQISARIILIVDTILEEEKNILISKGIFDILKDDEIEISDVIEAVDREEPIHYKLQIEKERKELFKNSVKEESERFEVKEEKSVVTKVQKQEVIAVFGTVGSGKSSIVAGFAKTFSQKTKARILVIDLDTLNGNLEELFQVSKIPENIDILIDEDKKCGINYVADLILKNRFDANVFDEIVIPCDDFDFLSGNTSLHYCQNVLNATCYDKLLEVAKQKYDFILIDCSSNIFLDSTKWALQNSNRVLFVTENSSICLKKTMQQLDVILNLWKMWKEKIQIVLNKTTVDGLSEDLFNKVCEIKVIGNIRFGAQEIAESYQSILETLEFIPKRKLVDFIEMGKEKVLLCIKNKKAERKVDTKKLNCV